MPLKNPSAGKNENSPTPDNSTQEKKQFVFEDRELIEKFADESTRHYAFNLIVSKYQERLYRSIRRMILDHDDSNDVLQNVFIKVWKNLSSFRSDSQLYTWLFRIAANESLTFLKQKKRRNLFSFESVENKMMHSLQSDILYSGDQIEMKLQAAILKLPPKQRLVFNMKYYDGMKYEEMSAILGVTTGALKANYHFAVKKIAEYVTSA